MGKRLSFNEVGKCILDVLREGEKKQWRWKEFKELRVRGIPIPDKSLERLLDFLDYCGLAEKDEHGYWIWYENLRVYKTKLDYDLALEHSRKLLPIMQSMIERITGIRAKDASEALELCIREHLKTYPEVNRALEKFEVTSNDRIRYLMQKYGTGNSLFNLAKGPLGDMIVKDLKKNEDAKEIDELRAFWTNEENLRDFAKIAGHFMALSSMVEIGFQPLEGICPLCPTNIRIAEPENKISKSDKGRFKEVTSG
jgi:hypothetical protein